MNYEEHLDEVTTLITEKYAVEDEAAIQMVMRAQADDFFSGHDDDPTICTLDRAHRDAKIVFEKYSAAAGKPAGRPAGKPAGKPSVKPAGKPAANQAANPAAPPAAKPRRRTLPRD